MYPAEFDYVKVSSLEEAISLKQQGDENSILAGGHSLICLLYTSPSPRDNLPSRMPSSA